MKYSKKVWEVFTVAELKKLGIAVLEDGGVNASNTNCRASMQDGIISGAAD